MKTVSILGGALVVALGIIASAYLNATYWHRFSMTATDRGLVLIFDRRTATVRMFAPKSDRSVDPAGSFSWNDYAAVLERKTAEEVAWSEHQRLEGQRLEQDRVARDRAHQTEDDLANEDDDAVRKRWIAVYTPTRHDEAVARIKQRLEDETRAGRKVHPPVYLGVNQQELDEMEKLATEGR